ncbi:Lipid transfer-like protein VAS, partial [Cucurbita argyrosperma subsp. argyrosperma]
MEMKPWTGILTAMLLVLASAMAFQGRAQDTSCMNRLIPCLNYLNGTRDPPSSCCNPLKSVIDSNPDCLCALISRDGSDRAEQAGIDVSQAQLLPGRCGEHVNPLSCLAAANNARNFLFFLASDPALALHLFHSATDFAYEYRIASHVWNSADSASVLTAATLETTHRRSFLHHVCKLSDLNRPLNLKLPGLSAF